ncbi:hypothetical protein B0T17DRAFT_487878 [Bombardia bombarda]|uniref:FAD-binding PCMH-type domain-containing protein n=1 Tax=Bombardia bombarda TaxID=252184 RepID=A0AA39XC13_9PEZI|nr:hypothetical protein B0T17DRAFT_487878 [Bombardia bombarda]
MGNHQTALSRCIDAVGAGRSGFAAYPHTPLYEMRWVKPYNLDARVEPAAVVRPETSKDIAGIIACASTNKVKIQARSGGHSFANYGLGGEDGAVSIDMVNFQHFHMDNSTWKATIGAGTRLGDVTDKLDEAGGRAIAHGVCPDVGLGGHATIGGLGPMSRMWGSCLDHILEVEVVTADGKVQRASESHNSDLFWAIRGAAGSFGVVTEFVMKTRPAPPTIIQYSYSFNFGKQSEMAPLFSKWQAIVADPKLDRRFGTEFIIMPLGAVITGTFYGTEAEYKATGIPGRIPGGGKQGVATNDWRSSLVQNAENEALYLSKLAAPFYSKSLGFKRSDMIPPDKVQKLFEWVDETDKGTLIWFVIFSATGGATADVAMEATSYSHRDKVMFYESYVIGVPLRSKSKNFLTKFHMKVLDYAPNGTYGTYAGYVDPGLEEGQKHYWGSNLPLLEGIKRKYDPADTFSNPQSVRPVGSL